MQSTKKYTPNMIRCVRKSEHIGRSYGCAYLEEIHIFYCLITEESTQAKKVLVQMGINQEHLLKKTEEQLSKVKRRVDGKIIKRVDSIYGTKAALTCLEKAEEEQKRQGHPKIGTIHLLLSMVKYPDEGMDAIINEYGITVERIERAEEELSRRHQKKTLAEKKIIPSVKGEVVEEDDSTLYYYDMVEMAKIKQRDPVIGRDIEVRNLILILSRKTKNNPCLVGEPGVGKTAVVEGLAQRIAKGDVPDSLLGKRLLSVDLGAMVAGAKYRGEFEGRLQKLLNMVKRDSGNTLLFIDELHNIISAGSSEGGGMDAGNMLKPMLARGELHCIGATTLDEYSRYIQKDAALDRRFQKLLIEEPSEENAISILRGLKERYEIYHGVKIMDDALVSAVKLSIRYLPERFLPDKAIDLVDESCAMIKNELDTMPAELDELERKIVQMEIEESALRLEGSSDKLSELENEIISLKEKFYSRKAQWVAEKASVEHVSELRQKLEVLNESILRAKEDNDIEAAARLSCVELPKLQREIALEEENISANGSMIHEKVTEDEIAQTLSRWTKIPLIKLSESDRERTLHLPQELQKRIIGQEQAVKKVAQSIIRSRAGIKDPARPIGSFLFMGPTGVGKTELAKALSDTLFNGKNNLIRIDMTEYMEKFSVSRLIGAPPGYVGYDSGGQLTEAVRRNPYSVILFDEVEKAHADVMNILLQILDDGRATDSHGKVVDFKNTIIILTSNIGAENIINGIDEQGNIRAEVQEKVSTQLKQHFRPEMLNRLDEVITFTPLSREHIAQIADLIINGLNQRLEEKGVHITFTKEALQVSIEKGYDSIYGARPLKRYIQEHAETAVAILLLEGTLRSEEIIVDVRANGEFIAYDGAQYTVPKPKFNGIED